MLNWTSCFVLICGVAMGTGCGDDATPSSDAGTTSDAGGGTDAGPALVPEGHIQITVEGITGAMTKLLLVQTASPGGPRGTYCVGIDADPFTHTGTISTPTNSENPCEFSDPVVFDPGTYPLFAGIYVPGSMTPDSCARFDAVVEAGGGLAVTVPALTVTCD